MSACVTLDEVLAAAHARCASLVPETSGYLALAVGDATSRLPLRLDDRAVLLTTEGTVTVRSRGEPVAPAEAARLLRDLLARLLAASAGSMPNLAATARPRPKAEQDPDAVARELEAALIPVNRNAARRALARLARETLRAREAGRLKRARAEVQAAPPAPAASEQPAAPVRPACAAAAPRDEVGGAQRGEVAAPPLAPAVVELTLSPGPVAPAIVELTLSPGLVACETAGPTLPAPALGSGSDEIAARAAVVEPPSEVAPAPAHAAHPGEQAEAFPEPTPTVVQAVVEIETAAALVELPVVPELVEPARAVARVAPIAPSAPAIVPAEARATPALSPADGAACREALTSPEGIEALLIELSPDPTEVVSLPQEPTPSESILVELSPDPAGVAPLPQEPTPSESILVELSPDPTGVVPLSQEPTPTVATAVWEERVAAESAAVISVTEAPADVIDAASSVPADVVDAATEAPADVVDAATEAPADVVDAAADAIEAAADAIDAAADASADVIDAATEAPEDIVDAAADAPADILDAAADAPADIFDAAADAPADIFDAAADAPAGIPYIAPDAAETARAPAIHFLLEAEAALQVTPAYGGWPLVHRRDAAAVSIGPRSSVAPLEETPAARHTLPWPIPAQRGDDAPAAAAPATHTAAPAPAPAPAEASPSPQAEATTAAHAGATPADAEPAEEPCPAGLSPIDAIVWSASRRSRSARPPADGAGTSRVDELVARFAAQSEHSAQRRAARSMKALAGLDLTLTPPPVAALSATATRALPDARSPLADARRPVPSEGPAPGAGQVALDESSRPPVPVVTPRRKGLSLWLALVALALLCAVLVGTLRPELFTALAEPLARGALRAVPRAEARTPPPHD
ncbi:hypothetical protein WMF37_36140 [Sorangium sp. So ce291]|uniref:hypothetical protein n=1 Tax=Sorangium sp. So ce291 TaxID=3133294 RepID=UPI003F5E3CF1